MKEKFKLSIIIPYYNGVNFYNSLLKSIKSSLSNCNNLGFYYELITIVDSMETESSDIFDIATSIFQDLPEVSIVVKKNNKNIGVAGSRNQALDIAQGEFLHIIDQDDQVDEMLYPTTIPMLNKCNFIMVNGIVHYNDSIYNSHKLLYFKPDLTIRGLLKDDFIRSPGQIIFSKFFTQELRFPEPKKFKGADDRFFWLRIFFKYEEDLKINFIKAPLYIAFIHNNNYSADSLNLRRSSLENWEILLSEIDAGKYRNLINADINSLKFAANERLGFVNKIFGAYYRFLYFFSFNKIVRLFFKRIKPTIKSYYSFNLS